MSDLRSPFLVPNVRLFVLFRLFFNARLYYPIFTVLFLDFGLSLEQFAILNAVWAAAIVLLEVPSGALADTIGRVNLLRVTGVLMVLEMALLCFVPLGNVSLIFWVFLVNRVLSGAAEAAASGADEALAYDSLAAAGGSARWSRVLEVQMRVQSVGFVVSMLAGSILYDAAFLERVLGWFGLGVTLDPEVTMRFPLYGVLLTACVVVALTWCMREPGDPEPSDGQDRGFWVTTGEALRTTLRAGNWILRTPFALVLIVAGFTFDNIVRMFLTLNSQYYRAIELPEASFGVVGATMGVLGVFVPSLARYLAERYSPVANFFLLAVVAFTGLVGIAFAWPYYGLLPVLLLVPVISISGFFVSHYLHRLADSRQRATVMSFKGLAFNLAYGLAGLLYGWLVVSLRMRAEAGQPGSADAELKEKVFVESLGWFPWYFLATVGLVIALALWRLRGDRQCWRAG